MAGCRRSLRRHTRFVGKQFQFGPFEFDTTSGELRRSGVEGPGQRLPPQPARLLALLAERQGEIVSREEIRERLWPDTNVDFDTSLHFCVRQVRIALGESAAEQSLVENVPRRGYRLAAAGLPVKKVKTEVEIAKPVAARRPRAVWVVAAAVVAALSVGYLVVTRRAPAVPPVRIGIMPFQPPDRMKSNERLAIAESILEDLVAPGGSALIVGPTTTVSYSESDAALPRLASDYQLAYIVNGRFLDAPGRPRMLAELIRVSDGAHIWVRGYDNLSDGRSIGHEIATNVARELKLAR
jgi:DNA-binding winged helix-turn-helix (wHTH) protein/TolB-like protein